MSTATAFRYPRSFPFCVTDISGSVPADANYIANLTLTQVMAFAWNLETFTLTTAGSAASGGNTADGACSFTLEDLASSRLDTGSSGGDMWYGNPRTSVAFSSWPSIRQPVARICAPSSSVINGALLDFGAVYGADPGTAFCELGFFIGTDPVNSGKYRLYYDINFAFRDPATETVEALWSADSSVAGMTAWTNGTITIAGLTFSWYSYYSSGATPSGTGAMSATSGSFTY